MMTLKTKGVFGLTVLVLSVLLSPLLSTFLDGGIPMTASAAATNTASLPPGEYAELETSMGTIVCQLFPASAPETVANFVGLAEGTKEFIDPRTGTSVKRAFFDGLVFHRVIKDFMIQGGDPLGNGTGGPGYQFKNEVDPSLHFDRKGIMAMANAGPDTNGSQFFITVAPATWLDGSYSIFGQVVSGQDVADKISQVPTGKNDRPLTPVTILHVKIIRVAP
ncbi:MAG: peptidylprolyl isomerase [Leptospirales bacterium]|jgi:peptidyl-prolyl cis-trans isomerase A (cyclophilin A)